jgi:hypothetical protein
MFGLSLPKLILLALVVAAVWYGFKYLQARERQLARAARKPPEPRQNAKPSPKPSPQATTSPEELVKCPVCATYVVRGAPGCGRADCPKPAHG